MTLRGLPSVLQAARVMVRGSKWRDLRAETAAADRAPEATNGLLNLGMCLPISFGIALLPRYSGAIDRVLLLSSR